MSEPPRLDHPCDWPYWRCDCGFEDVEAGEESFFQGGKWFRVEPCAFCGKCPACMADTDAAFSMREPTDKERERGWRRQKGAQGNG